MPRPDDSPLIAYAVRSPALAGMSYDSTTQTLVLEFLTGALYRYRDVPDNVVEALANDLSPARFFARHIRDRYLTERID